MKKSVLSAANFHQQKHYYNEEDYSALPSDVKKEVKQIVVYLAEKVHGTVSIGFYEDGNVFIECFAAEDDLEYDSIGAKLEIDKMTRKRRALFNALSVWYKVFRLGGKGLKV
ncbi:MAG: hypothetical protein IJR45_03610 [Firmicutes bacterium]|nr:hypothetical protein [Bacillota bacterium]MBQ9604481.1 hypothetical protein [Bacillota bacterium]